MAARWQARQWRSDVECRWTRRTYRVQVLAEERMDVILGIFRVRSLLFFLRVLDNGCHRCVGRS